MTSSRGQSRAYELHSTICLTRFRQRYADETPLALVLFLEQCVKEENNVPQKYTFYFGDRSTGAFMPAIPVITGFVALGPNNRFSVLPRVAAKNGKLLLIDSIVKITTGGKRGVVVYRHPSFHTPEERPPAPATDRRQLIRFALQDNTGDTSGN